MSRVAAALACAVLAALAGRAAAATPVLLPSTRAGLSEAPPLLARTRLPEQRFPGRIASRELVRVGVDATGRVRSVRVLQRLVVEGLGDYVFALGAPALEVRPAAGSRSEPGFRRDAIVWQGFSPGRRLLAADARLRVGVAAAALPLRVSIERGTLTLENVTAIGATGFGGEAPRREVEAAFRAIRRAAAAGTVTPDLLVHTTGLRPRRVRIDTALRIEGEFDGRRVAAVLGGGRPNRLIVRGRASARPRLDLVVKPIMPARAFAGPPSLHRAVDAALLLARLRQYQTFLANPDPVGPAQATYEFRLEPARPAAQPVSPGDGWSTAAVAAAVVAGLAAAGGLLALWARS
jgi:hypothetical protein